MYEPSVPIRGLLAGIVLVLTACTSGGHPLTGRLLDAGLRFEEVPGFVEAFDEYAASPTFKAFAAAVRPDGAVHAWAKA